MESVGENVGENVAKVAGESVGEKIATDTAITAPLDETGLGELIDVGLIISTLATSFADLFQTKPHQEQIEEGQQVGL